MLLYEHRVTAVFRVSLVKLDVVCLAASGAVSSCLPESKLFVFQVMKVENLNSLEKLYNLNLP